MRIIQKIQISFNLIFGLFTTITKLWKETPNKKIMKVH